MLTRYRRIEDIDVERSCARAGAASSPLTAIIERAVKIASDYLVPHGIDRAVWRGLIPEERLYVKGIEVETTATIAAACTWNSRAASASATIA